MSTTYLVDVELALHGGLAGKVGNLANQFTGLIERVGAVAAGFAAAGMTAGIGAITMGVFHLNKELENTKISLGAIYNAKGISSDLTGGIELAATSIARMRKDAADLPGEFEDLRQILMTMATPALNAGSGIEGLHTMAANTMAVAAVMGVDKHMAAREMAQLIEGRAGTHNVLGTRLGFTGEKAHHFNKSAPAERLRLLNVELGKYQPAIEAFSKSWDGISSSTTSTAKILLTTATSPLFESIKSTLMSVNQWMDKNKVWMDDWAVRIGKRLDKAFHVGVEKIQEWYPYVRDFAETAFDHLRRVWERIQPYVEQFGHFVENAFKDPGAMLDRVETVLKLYAAVKVGGVALNAGANIAQMIAPLVSMGAIGKVGGALGGGAAVLSAGAAAKTAAASAQAATALEAAAIASEDIGLAMTKAATSMALPDIAAFTAPATAPALTGLAAVAVPAAIAVVGLAGAISLLSDKTSEHHALGMKQMKDMDVAWRESSKNFDEAWASLKPSLQALSEELGIALLFAASAAVESIEGVSWALRKFLKGFGLFDNDLGALNREHGGEKASAGWKGQSAEDAKTAADKQAEILELLDADKSSDPYALLRDAKKHQDEDALMKKLQHKGGAGMHINTVEIQVTSNNEPGRVAQLVLDKLQNLRKHPKHTPNGPVPA